ncbi:competence protein CoiA family protein [Prescottella equi]
MSCNKIGSMVGMICTERCCVSLFGSRRERLGGEVIGFDVDTREIVSPSDYPREYWRAKGPAGDGSLVCPDCLHDDPANPRVLGYYETEPGRPFFRHRSGEAPEGEGTSGESAWHQAVKYGIARWARTQPAVKAVDVEWTLPSGQRRTDVHVRLLSGREFEVEVQYSPIDAALHADRQRDYYEAGVTPIWLYSIGLDAPRWAGDNLTFGIRLGPVDEHAQSTGSQLELGVPFSTPGRVDPWTTATAENYIGYAPFRPHAQNGVLWMPIGSAVLTDAGVIVAPNPLEVLRTHGLAEAEAAAGRHNKGRERLIRDARARSHQRYIAGSAESARRSATRVSRPTGVVCQGCGGALDPILRQYGRHPGC